MASLEWDKITLQGWIDELSAGGLIPSTEVVGGVSDEGNVYANSLSADQQADLESQLAIIRQEPINSADDYFSEENMVDLVGRVTSDPNAATASSNAEEVFSEYDGENIEDRRAQTRKGLLLDNLYEQHYEFCDYEHFNPLGYSYEKLQRYVVDENGERIDRGNCKVYSGVSTGYIHKIEACSLQGEFGSYVANMTRYIETSDRGRFDIETCAPQAFPITERSCGVSHDLPSGYSTSRFTLHAETGYSGFVQVSECSAIAGLSTRYPHSYSECGADISHPQAIISETTSVSIDGQIHQIAGCSPKHHINLNYSSCGVLEESDGFTPRYRYSYNYNGETRNSNSCSVISGLSVKQNYTYESCGFSYQGGNQTSLFEASYEFDGTKHIYIPCGVIDGHSETTIRQTEVCNHQLNLNTDSATIRYKFKDSSGVCGEAGTEEVDTNVEVCSGGYSTTLYSILYYVPGLGTEGRSCSNPVAAKISDIGKKRCSWIRRKKYRDYVTYGGAPLGRYYDRCK